ncbi:hypothetical protein bcere0025_38780 [Bacillus cereus F65185]|nr:hypothetical protein bcere0005_38280 [Bacillus cereus 172560W]EEL54364.1 hypothetical protein bcere0023_40970 [Bacillus cereus Rock4-2]EEL63400.1 hypothetical protein bcere0025_38780 [Bacillus cereus F65185]
MKNGKKDTVNYLNDKDMTIPNLTFELIQHCFPKPSENMYIKKMMQQY